MAQLPEDANLPCVTCEKVFNQLDVVICDQDSDAEDETIKHEDVLVDKDELRNSAESGCGWCIAQWHHLIERYEEEGRRMFNFKDAQLEISISWGPNRLGSDRLPVYLDSYMMILHDGGLFSRLHCPMVVEPICEAVNSAQNTYGLPTSTSSAACHNLAMGWWKECKNTHAACKINRDPVWLPTRLVDVRDPPKLVATRYVTDKELVTYFALSHRWGASQEEVFKLLSSNEKELMHTLSLEQLSQVFRDAIDFTRRSGVQYLWIDSLCIMQDSEEDWKAEAALMSKVYANCALNIAADPVAPGESGMFQTRSYHDCCYIATHQKTFVRKDVRDEYLLALRRNLGINEYAARSLQGRAWIFQERLLSPRTLCFSDQLFWECREKLASETFPIAIDFNHGASNAKERALYIQPGDYNNFRRWYELLHSYLRCDLTFPKDRLAALGAVAEYSAGRLEATYCAGLWRERMPACLLWGFSHIKSQEVTRQTTYRCPTWSWASLDFSKGVFYNTAFEGSSLTAGAKMLSRIIDINIESPLGNIYTDIKSAEIILEGHVQSVKLQSLGNSGCSLQQRRDCGYALDLGAESANGLDIYMLPVASRYTSRNIYALLLIPSQTFKVAFERCGVALIERETCPEELSWVFHIADAEDRNTRYPNLITLV